MGIIRELKVKQSGTSFSDSIPIGSRVKYILKNDGTSLENEDGTLNISPSEIGAYTKEETDQKIISEMTILHVVPFQTGTLTYNGSAQEPEWNGYNQYKMIIGGTTSATNAGTYTATFKPLGDYTWEDGTTDTKSVTWKITGITVAVPSQSGTLTYTGSAQSPSWSNYDSSKLTIGGTTSGTNAGSYNATFTPKTNYQWSDGTQAAKTVTWTINKATATLPSQSGTLTYTGASQSPSWSNYVSSAVTLGGTTSGTNAGSYNATFTPTANYQWSDGGTSAKSVTWKINKATPTISVASSASLKPDESTTVTVTYAGDGTLSVSSSNTSIATCSISNKVIAIKGVADGSATITVKAAAGTNYNAASDATISVTVKSGPSAVLGDNTPDLIQQAAQDGTASSLWAVGDAIGIALSGTVAGLSLSSTYYAYIIGFDHNSSYEGTKKIHFQMGKDSSGVNIAFVNNYGSYGSSTSYFNMNNSNTNSGGWSSSKMRGTICPQFLAALPTSWQNVIVSLTKYSDNTGGGSSTASYVTSTSDKIWLLSEYEVFGSRSYANSAESTYQKQYDYYKNGNSKIRYKHSDTPTACQWWLRSVDASSSVSFCRVLADGSAYYSYADYSKGFAPGFAVG